MNQFKKNNRDIKLYDDLSKVRRYCLCGHSVFIPYPLIKLKCSYCHRWVYISNRDEFKDTLSKKLNIENLSKRKRGV